MNKNKLPVIFSKHILPYTGYFHKRTFHAYCIGAAKTGTTSVAKIFNHKFRSAHEPETMRTNKLVINYLEKKIDKATVVKFLKSRDNRLNLDFESAHPLVYVSDILPELFPQSKFIITVREPYSWLQSRLNYHYKKHPKAWKYYRDYFWTKKHKGYPTEELALEKFGLCSLDTYLTQYADHYSRLQNNIPKERSLVIQTDKLKDSLDEIGTFIGIQPGSLQISHSNRETEKISPLDEIDEEYLKQKIMHHCEDIISNFFPE